MTAESKLEEVGSEIYKGRTIILYRETIVQDDLTQTGFMAQITPSEPELEWQDGLMPDEDAAFDAARNLIDAKRI